MENKIDILISAKDYATATMKKASASVDSFMEKNKAGMQAIGVASGIALTGIVALGTGALQQASKMQDLRQSFDTMLGSAEKGKQLFQDVQKFAAATPYDTAQLASVTSGLLNNNIALEKVMDTTRMLGDISLGSAEKMNGLSYTFGQINTQGKLTADNLRELRNRAFDPLAEMARTSGKSMKYFADEMSEGRISADMVAEAMRTATAEGGKFYKGMENGSKTFSGVMSTLRDNIGITLAAIAGFSNGEVVKGGLLDILTQGMQTIMPYLDSFAQWASENGTMIAIFLGIAGALAGVLTVVTGIGLLIPALITGFTTIGTVFGVTAGVVASTIAIFAGIIVVLGLLYVAWSNNFLGIRDITASVWAWIVETFNAGVAWIMATIQPFLIELQKFWKENGEVIMAYLRVFFAFIKTIFTTHFQTFALIVQTGWNIIKAIFITVFDIIKVLVKGYFMAFSGIFTAGMQVLNGNWSGAWETIKNTFSNILKMIVDSAKEWGKNMMTMMINGISNKLDAFKSKVGEVAMAIYKVLGFGSPTEEGPGKNSDEWMPNLVDMLVEGLTVGKALIEKSAEDLARQIGGAFSKEKFDALKQNIVSFMDQAQNVWNKMGDNITDQKEKIKGLSKEYGVLAQQMKDVMAEIAGLGVEKTGSLAGRAYEIQKEIADMSGKSDKTPEDFTKIDALNKELSFIKEQGITEEQIQTAKDLANRTEAQRIIDSFTQRQAELEDKKLKIQEEMTAKATQIADEYAKYKQMEDEKKKFAREYRNLTHLFFQEQLSETQQLIQAMRQLEAARAAAQGPTVSGARALGGPVTGGNTYLVGERGPELFTPASSGNITPNNQLGGVQISINMGGVSVRNDNDINSLARAIKDELTRDLQLSRLGIA